MLVCALSTRNKISPFKIFICKRGSNESVNGRQPVKSVYSMTPRAQMSWLGRGCNASEVWGRSSSGAAYGREPGGQTGLLLDVEFRWRTVLCRFM